MRLVEQHVIGKSDARYQLIDAACFASKNLYNAANYLVRQSFIHESIYKGYAVVYHEVKHHEAYKALPAKVANDVLRLLDKTGSPSLRQLKHGELTLPCLSGVLHCRSTKTSRKGATSSSMTFKP